MTDYWSRAPFISHDGPDDKGVRAEVKVTLGFAVPTEIEASDKGKAARVKFPVDNTKWPSTGWAPVDSNVMKLVQEAHDNETPLYFRIETIRKPGVDRTESIVDLTKGSDAARENANKSLAAVKREDDDEWTISSRAMTRLDEDPTQEGGTSAYNHSLEELKGATTTATVGSAPAVEPLTVDGKPNFKSSAVLVPAEFFRFLSQYAANEGFDVDTASLRSLSKMLLAASNKIQVATSHGELEEADLTDSSHETARRIVTLTVETIVPFTQEVVESPENQTDWAGKVLKSSLSLLKWSAGEAVR